MNPLSLKMLDTELKNQLANKNFNRKFTPGMSIAVTAGSRGVANMALTIRTVCDFLKEIDVNLLLFRLWEAMAVQQPRDSV